MSNIVIKQDLLKAKEAIIIHGCNMQGKMNSGVAKCIRDKYPKAYQDYIDKLSEHRLGQVITSLQSDGKIIANCLTQKYYGREPGVVYANIDAVHSSLSHVKDIVERSKIWNMEHSVALPKIGCGLGGLDWSDVSDIVYELLPEAVVYEI